MEQEVTRSTPGRLSLLVHPRHHHRCILSMIPSGIQNHFIGDNMRKFTQTIIGKGVTFTKLAKVRDTRGRVDFERIEIEGIVTENDGYVCTVRGWDGVMHTNVETTEIKTWQEADRSIEEELSCLV